MATIDRYETKAGPRYSVRYRKPDRTQGRKRGFRTKRDARLWLAQNVVDRATGNYIDPSSQRVTVGELGAEWLARQTHLKPSTLRTVKSAWANHVEPKWATWSVGDVSRTDVSTWVSALSKTHSYTTVTRCLGVLSGIMDSAVDDRRIPSNPASKVKNIPQRSKGRDIFLTARQVEDLANAAGEHRTLVLSMAYSGLRWGEITGLRVRHLDLEKRRITVEENAVAVGSKIVTGTTKSHERRIVPIPRFLVPMLRSAVEGKADDDLVFSRDDGTHIRRPKTGRSWFWAAIRESGAPEELTPHSLRHTAASMAISAGANVKVVQRMLGHSSAAMTLDRYGHLFPDDLDAVADGLDAMRCAQIVPTEDSTQKNDPPTSA